MSGEDKGEKKRMIDEVERTAGEKGGNLGSPLNKMISKGTPWAPPLRVLANRYLDSAVGPYMVQLYDISGKNPGNFHFCGFGRKLKDYKQQIDKITASGANRLNIFLKKF